MRSQNLGHDPAKAPVRHKLDLIVLDWPLRRGRGFRTHRSFAEAAYVQSRLPTEPMRRSSRSPSPLAGEGRGEGEEFAAVSIPRERSRQKRRYPSGIELAVLLGLHVARRGFWDATRALPFLVERGG